MVRASNFIFGSVALGTFGFLFTNSDSDTTRGLFSFLLIASVHCLLAFLLRREILWIRYIFVVTFALAVCIAPFVLLTLLVKPVQLLLFIGQIGMQISAIVLMFRKGYVDQPLKVQAGSDETEWSEKMRWHWTSETAPKFPCLVYFIKDGEERSFEVMTDYFHGTTIEMQDAMRKADPTERYLDRNGNIFNVRNHQNGFLYPMRTLEKPNAEMINNALKELGEVEFGKFIPVNELDNFIKIYTC